MAIAPLQSKPAEEIFPDLPEDFADQQTVEALIGQLDYDPGVHIAKQEILKPAKTVELNGSGEEGVIELLLFRMTDGTAYEVMRGTPLEPKTAVTVASRPALGTSIQGYNQHTLQLVTSLGLPSVLVGSEGGHRDGWVPHWPRRYTLAQSAHNEHEILDALEIENIVAEGKSWGAMVGFGTIDLASEHDRAVVYAEFVDPVGEVDWKELLKNPKRLGEVLFRGRHELAAMASLAVSLSVNRLWHYKNSLNLSPNFIMQSVRELFQITNGETLRLAEQVPLDTNMHLQIFMDNLVSQGEEIAQIFARHPNVRLSPLHRGHMWIPSEDTDFGVEMRLGYLANELERTGDKIEEVDFSKVHLDISTLDEVA